MDLSLLTARTLARAWQLAGSVVQACTYVVPAGFSPATGLTAPSETSVAVQAMIAPLRPYEWDGIVTNPGDERVLIRANELGAVVPVRGDYLLGPDGVRRDVQWARKVACGLVWVLYGTPSLAEDRGDLAAHTSSEDWGDLTAATTSEDWGMVA